MLNLARLTAEQRQAVVAPNGPLLLIAGPGTGKTTVLAARIGYLVSVHELAPASILAVTFTKAAGQALRWRLGGVLGQQARELDIMTFHAFGWRVVRQWWEELGYGHQQLLVYGREEAEWLLARAVEELDLDRGQQDITELLRSVDRFRLTGAEPMDRASVAPLARMFEGLLRSRNAVDFTAMLALPLRLLHQHEGALRLYQDAYRAILLDEFQDVSPEQYELVRKLAERHRNVTAAGDAAQCLFGWRGADMRLMDRFRQDFPGTRVSNLVENFRSTGRIVGAANALGHHLANAPRLRTDNEPGLAPIIYAAADERAEASFVATEIERLTASGALDSLADVAVLYRTKQQAFEVTLALRARHIRFRIRGGGDLLARREVRTAISYLRLAENPADALALANVVNVPPRRLTQLASQLADEPVPVSELTRVAERFGLAAAGAAAALVQMVEGLHRLRRDPPALLLDAVMERTELGGWLQAQPGGRERLANLEALRSLLARSDEGLTSWLAGVASGEDVGVEDDRDRVALATIHVAKGDEWPMVFVMGLEEALLPHHRAVLDEPFNPDAVEEELRVAYVAFTRARTRLYLTYCRQRRRDSQLEPRKPSRFLRYLGPDPLTERRAA